MSQIRIITGALLATLLIATPAQAGRILGFFGKGAGFVSFIDRTGELRVEALAPPDWKYDASIS